MSGAKKGEPSYEEQVKAYRERKAAEYYALKKTLFNKLFGKNSPMYKVMRANLKCGGGLPSTLILFFLIYFMGSRNVMLGYVFMAIFVVVIGLQGITLYACRQEDKLEEYAFKDRGQYASGTKGILTGDGRNLLQKEKEEAAESEETGDK